MPSFEESGLVVTLPDESFRFATCKTYERLKCHALKEMDFGYWHAERACAVLLELKDYSQPATLPQYLLDELVEKGRHSLLMLHAAWSRRGEGQALASELPEVLREEKPLRLYFVLKLQRSSIAQIQSLRDLLRSRVLVFAQLLGLKAQVSLLDHEKARALGIPVA